MKLLRTIALLLFVCAGLYAQEKTPEQIKQEKEFYENLQKEVERLEMLLDLEPWQTFYVDSILTHDYTAMQDEVNELMAKKVNNTDMYYAAQDKWLERIYQSFEKILDEDQWAKYQKTGAAREKKNRDKRAAKRSK